MKTYRELAEVIFPEIRDTVQDLESKYPPRNLWEGAEVTRFAPSPTGFLHTGSLFTAMVARTVAKRSKGVFFLRLEDTDTKREIQGSEIELVKQLNGFGVGPDEGFKGDHEFGVYGPYRQSERANVYKAVLKHMISEGKVYPCFMSVEDLDAMRKQQESDGVLPGYYGKYAKYRNLTAEESIDMVNSGNKFVLRFKSNGNKERYFEIDDIVRGEVRMPENDQDVIVLKSDGLPTYHFAHVVDDHFMRTTIVSRGEEWLSSLPIHVQMFSSLGWDHPRYAHLPVIMKMDGGSRRKLSKRNDPEASVSFFSEKGYPSKTIIEYLMTLANSNYEKWRSDNPKSSNEEFPFDLSKMPLDGALLDMEKVNWISKEVVSRMTTDEILSQSLSFAKSQDKELLSKIEQDPDFYKSILSIERNKDKPRKDIACFSEINPSISTFYEKGYSKAIYSAVDLFNKSVPTGKLIEALEVLSEKMDTGLPEKEWFESFKKIGDDLGFCQSVKDYKKDPSKYFGHVGDFAEILRIAIFCSKQSPNIYEVMQVIGKEKTKFRIDLTKQILRDKRA